MTRIHHKQTLALFCLLLPFAMASEMDWWAVPLTAFVAFTLYGIEGIAQTYEDPFGVAKIDINIDDIVLDARREVEVLLSCWQTQGSSGGLFRNHLGEPPSETASETDSLYTDDPNTTKSGDGSMDNGANVRFVVQSPSQPSSGGTGRLLSAVSPGTILTPTPNDYFAAEEGTSSFNFRKESAVSPGTSPLRHVVGSESYDGEWARGGRRSQGGKRLAWSDGG
jgi:hypothetical protein